MTLGTIAFIGIIATAIAIAIYRNYGHTLKKKKEHHKHDAPKDKPGDTTKGGGHGHGDHDELGPTGSGGCIPMILVAVAFIALLTYVVIDYLGEIVHPWEREVHVKLSRKTGPDTFTKETSFKTPRTIEFNYAFDIDTDSHPYAVLWSGTTIPICYCDDEKDPYVGKRNKGPNKITKPSEACWKMCRTREKDSE